jgi:hypothetical protein
MQAEAVTRAAAPESCRLTWNEAGRRHELAHPAIGRHPSKSPRFMQSPTSPLKADLPVLHITVTSHALSSAQSISTTLPIISVTNPNHSSTMMSTPANTRVSTLPVHDSEEALASLDFDIMTLHISAKQILQLNPSLYALTPLSLQFSPSLWQMKRPTRSWHRWIFGHRESHLLSVAVSLVVEALVKRAMQEVCCGQLLQKGKRLKKKPDRCGRYVTRREETKT